VNVSPGGLPKRAVASGFIATLGLRGDKHAHPAIHGGPRKAVLLIAAENVEELTHLGFPVFPGRFGRKPHHARVGL